MCGGDDCDDDDPLRWNGHADEDGDGHTDARCCTEDTPLCDDCDDDDPLRWGGNADLDGDGHDSTGCGGDDCDDTHPDRWIGHADVDADGRQDDRCCPDCEVDRLDCNDNDPRRWTGNSDLDGDGHHDARCRCDPSNSEADCAQFDDCDDDCFDCFPDGIRFVNRARDHDCNGIVDDLETPPRAYWNPTIVDQVAIDDSLSLAVIGTRAFVGSADGIYEVETHPTSEIVSDVRIGAAVEDVAVWNDLILAATPDGLVVVRRRLPTESAPDLNVIARLRDTGQSRGVYVSYGYAYVAAYEGLFVVDLSDPSHPVVVEGIGEPLIHDLRHVSLIDLEDEGRFVLVVSRSTSAHPGVGGLTSFRLESATDLEVNHQMELGRADSIGLETDTARVLVATERGVTVVGNLSNSQSTMELQGTNACIGVANHTIATNFVFAAADSGLHVGYENLGLWNELLETGPSRDVALARGFIYVATSDGLSIVSTGTD